MSSVENKDGFVKMAVRNLELDEITKTPIVVLRDEAETRQLSIWIGLLEATSMATELEGVKMSRPMTHDLLREMIDKFGASVESIDVTELRENTFYAVIHLNFEGKHVTLDSRPSDAISLALRTESPIYVSHQVLEASSELNKRREEIAAAEGEEDGMDSVRRDLSDIAPEQWADILENLDPHDFKYKM
jgi:bifunctional DNase/RNase